MRKRSIIIAIALLFIVAVILVFSISNPEKQTKDDPLATSTQTATKAILNKYQEAGANYKSDNIVINKIDPYKDKWMIVTVTLLSEPPDSDGRIAIHVLEKSDEGLTRVIAYTSDGFSDNAFPDNTPEHVKERARQF